MNINDFINEATEEFRATLGLWRPVFYAQPPMSDEELEELLSFLDATIRRATKQAFKATEVKEEDLASGGVTGQVVRKMGFNAALITKREKENKFMGREDVRIPEDCEAISKMSLEEENNKNI